MNRLYALVLFILISCQINEKAAASENKQRGNINVVVTNINFQDVNLYQFVNNVSKTMYIQHNNQYPAFIIDCSLPTITNTNILKNTEEKMIVSWCEKKVNELGNTTTNRLTLNCDSITTKELVDIAEDIFDCKVYVTTNVVTFDLFPDNLNVRIYDVIPSNLSEHPRKSYTTKLDAYMVLSTFSSSFKKYTWTLDLSDKNSSVVVLAPKGVFEEADKYLSRFR
jgi:acyl carrier protein